jgi:hypothetical protein
MTTRQLTYTLLDKGTRVKAVLGGQTVYGVVEFYEHYSPYQTTFPVRFGPQWLVMTSTDVTVLPEDQQPPDRQPPRRTGLHTRTD